MQGRPPFSAFNLTHDLIGPNGYACWWLSQTRLQTSFEASQGLDEVPRCLFFFPKRNLAHKLWRLLYGLVVAAVICEQVFSWSGSLDWWVFFINLCQVASYARRQMAWLHTAMQLCHIQHIFKVAFRKRFLMHLFLRKLILYTLSLAFSDLSHDIAFKN